jgi:hypothetical protein
MIINQLFDENCQICLSDGFLTSKILWERGFFNNYEASQRLLTRLVKRIPPTHSANKMADLLPQNLKLD